VCQSPTKWDQTDGAPQLPCVVTDDSAESDGVTFEAIEESGAESFLGQIREELVTNTYRPMRARKKEIPKDGGKKVRILSIPAIRDRVVQGALKLILEPIFEADFQAGSYGYRPKRTAHEAVARVAQAIVEEKTRINFEVFANKINGLRIGGSSPTARHSLEAICRGSSAESRRRPKMQGGRLRGAEVKLYNVLLITV
jgi:hypothetical protein